MTFPRILLIDLENSAHNADTWGLFDQNIPLVMLREPGHVMCFAYQWYGETKVHFVSEYHDGHEEMVKKAWDLLDQADMVIHYNGNKHDMPYFNTEFYRLRLGPPSPYKNIDLYLTVRSVLKFPSNKLEHVLAESGLAGKVKHPGYGMWLGCLAGDSRSWAQMKRYCVGDVTPLRELYEMLRPWIKNHPNVNTFDGVDDACPRCGSTDRQKRGTAHTATASFPQYRCNNCGGWFRGATAVARTNTRSYA